MDHGSRYLSDHFQKQIRYWGITPSFGCVEGQEANRVVECFKRTRAEQMIHGRIRRNVTEVREAVVKLVVDDGSHWRQEKLAFETTIESIREHLICITT